MAALMRKMRIDGPAGLLEATLRLVTPPRASAVVLHPHPVYGGTFDNPVVFHTDRRLSRAGWSTLRVNFRGVGVSEGAWDEGSGEKDDVGAAVRWMRGLLPDVPLFVVGYSFGAWCGLRHALDDPRVHGFVALGLPCRKYDMSGIGKLDRPVAVVQASDDEFGSLEEVRSLLSEADPPGRLLSVEGTNHLFPGRAQEAADRAVEAAEEALLSVADPATGQTTRPRR